MQLLTKLCEKIQTPQGSTIFCQYINNTSIAEKIAKQGQYAPQTLQDAFERALTLEAGLKLAKGVHLGRSPQVMQVSTSAPCHHDSLKNAYTKSMLEIAEPDLMLVGSVEDWATSKKLQGYPKPSRC